MKIAQIAPIWLRIPPKTYGGTENVVSNITEGLVKKGHDVALFATGDSITNAKLLPSVDIGLLEKGLSIEKDHYYLYHGLNAIAVKDEFDIMHFHFTGSFDYMYLALAINLKNAIFTYHVPLPTLNNNTGEIELLKKHFSKIPFISISNNQRSNWDLNFLGTVYNSVDTNKFLFKELPEANYIFFLSRLSKEKGILEAIKTANSLDIKLILSGDINIKNSTNIEYFNLQVKPYINKENIEMLGNLNLQKKVEYYQNAYMFLFPIQWEEPFGLVMIESMATGTPVIAFARGSVPEIVKDGETGFIVNSSKNDVRGNWIIKKTGIEGLCEAVKKIYSMPEEQYKKMRKNCREHVENNFTLSRMVDNYERVYKKILSK